MARDYDIAKASGLCCGCDRELQGGEEFVVVLREKGSEFQREDFCTDCWAAREGEARDVFSIWNGRIPLPEEPEKRFVANEVLVDFFEKLAGQDDPSRANLRFVLALMLMRKKLLVYDRSEADQAGREVWIMHFKSDPAPVRVIHPQLDEAQIAQVGGQLGAIFEVPT